MSNVKLIAACAAALGLAVLATNDVLAAQGGNSKLGQRDEELVLQAEQAGAVVTDPPHDRFWGGYSGYFRDPDDHLWEIAWNPQWSVPD